MNLENDTEVIRRNEVLKLVPISVSGLYQKISDGHFPRPIKLGLRAVGWKKSDVLKYLEGLNS
ncbi:MAG: helix-turn-helix transcriptional regulator [Paracoccaceae bacterium]